MCGTNVANLQECKIALETSAVNAGTASFCMFHMLPLKRIATKSVKAIPSERTALGFSERGKNCTSEPQQVLGQLASEIFVSVTFEFLKAV